MCAYAPFDAEFRPQT